MMQTSIDAKNLNSLLGIATPANKMVADFYPGDPSSRQPVHTVYGGAHLFKSDTAVKMAQAAQKTFNEYAATPLELSEALQMPPRVGLAEKVHERVLAKLKSEAVEDFRIDFEDGFGNRSDPEEDSAAILAAAETAKGMKEKTLPPFIGIRIKTFSEELKNRGVRTLDLFVTEVVRLTGGTLPSNFTVTLPKVTCAEQVSMLVAVLDFLEKKLKLPSKSICIELMVEAPQTLFLSDGRLSLPDMIRAADSRCRGAHFGTYDFTASMNITAENQVMDHTVCDFAKHIMKVSLSQTGIWLSDGATNIMPVGPHKGTELTKEEMRENKIAIHRAWRTSYSHIRHSLRGGYFQGWDLHPAQLPVRYATLYAFFLEGLDAVSKRLKNFLAVAAKATLVGDVFDDAATGQGLLNYFLKAYNCGAVTEEEILATGITMPELQSRSFVKIMKARREQN